jgi:hypothetical protein
MSNMKQRWTIRPLRSIKSAIGGAVMLISGLAVAYQCSWTWEQDQCLDVMCPSGCYEYAFGQPYSLCHVQVFTDPPLCCNCWYRERKCKFNGTQTRCYRQVPPAPNSYAWDCIREEAAGDCIEVSWVQGKVCLTAGEVPWPD